MFNDLLTAELDNATARNDYSPERCYNAWRLKEMRNSKARGDATERAIVNFLEKLGYTGIIHIGGNSPFDIMTDQGRIEVKSSMFHNNGFQFSNVHPHYFDMVVLVAVHPDWIDVRCMNRRMAAARVNASEMVRISLKNWKELDRIPQVGG